MLKRAAGGLFIAPAYEIDVEEVFPGLALQRSRFDLREIQVTQGEHAERLEQRARLITQREYDRRLDIGSGTGWLGCDGEESRVILGVILDSLFEDLHFIDLRGTVGSNGGGVPCARVLDELYAPRCVVGWLRA